MTEQRATERQLRQAQKMEAVGQLTGGVAHDFNNLLAVVIGNLEMLSQMLPHDSEPRSLVQEAMDAAERGASLTRRLLAFARQQTLRPIATQVGQLVADMELLLRRAVGETIVIRRAATDTWPAMIDPSQLESAILNLSLNARDAMPAGGTLVITTRNITIAPAQPAPDPAISPGDYVIISVADTGTGMPAAILDHVFEPFFTTKGFGEGSGLGLSMVFGFVKQSGGHIRVVSEPGAGTTVCLYLPRFAGAPAGSADAPSILDGGEGETILVVEDNPQLRRTTTAMVQALGYRVAVAEDASGALSLLDNTPGIDLMFTDIVLPGGMNGFDLAREVRRRRPDLPVLFTSGFVDPSTPHPGDLGETITILRKPFRRAELARALRTHLGRS